MSGGSYNYLCFKDADDILGRIQDLRDMANRLDGLCPEAAAETRAIFDGPRSLYAELEKRIERLGPLWKAVEWRDSSDWGQDQLDQAIADFRFLAPPQDMLATDAQRTHEIAELTRKAAALLDEARQLATRPWMGSS